MQNSHIGEVLLEVGSEKFTLRFSVDAMCRLEETTGEVLLEILTDLMNAKRLSVTRVRQLLHAGINERHPEIGLKEAGELIPRAGGMLVVMAKVSDAMKAAFPEASGTPRPPEAPNRAARRRAGTGKRS